MPIQILVVIILGLFIVFGSIFSWQKVNRYKKKVDEKCVLLEITPHSKTAKSPESIEQLYTLLHYLGANTRSSRSSSYSFEIVSTRHDGIRYLVRIPKKLEENFKNQIVSYLPGVKFKIAKDYVKELSIRLPVK